MYIYLGLILYCSTYECFWIYPLTLPFSHPLSPLSIWLCIFSHSLWMYICLVILDSSILLHVKLLPISTQTFPWFCSLGSSPVHTQSLLYFALYELLYALCFYSSFPTHTFIPFNLATDSTMPVRPILLRSPRHFSGTFLKILISLSTNLSKTELTNFLPKPVHL